MYLLDTNVFRELGRDDPHPSVGKWLKVVGDRELALSVLTIREGSTGIAKLRSHKPAVAAAITARTDAVLADFGDRLLPVTAAIATLWGELLGEGDKHATDMGLVATARMHDLVLVTRNLKHVQGHGVPTLDPFRARSGMRTR